MQYHPFGKTGLNISRLGFGTMRFPMVEVNGENVVDEDKAIPLIHRALELGINYFDSAFFYCEGHSEVALGKALKGRREDVLVSTKYPVGNEKGYRELLEVQLKKLDTDYVDFYHFHGIGGWFLEHERREEFVREAIQAKEEGLIRHISFSFHDKPEVMAQIIDLGIFSSVLCQYNLLDRSNEEAMANAQAKGLGVVVMGPAGGGRVTGIPPEVREKMGIQVHSSAELAFRFVLANPNVDCALSGMSTLEMVEENAATAGNSDPLSAAEVEAVNKSMEENQKLADLYCTGCDYCRPHCPEEVNIPHIFRAMNYYRVYGLKEYAKGMYNSIGSKWVKGANVDACLQCGECELHCPQKIAIREQLQEAKEVLGS